MTTSSRVMSDSLMKKWLPPGTPPPTADQKRQSYGIQGDMPGQDFLDEQQNVISQQLSGEIPQDVQDQVERISAEKSIKSGLGEGQAARNLTARDLGLTSLDIQDRGIKNAAQLSTTQNQFNQLEEQMRQWDDRILLEAHGQEIEGAKLTLAGYELIANMQMKNLELTNQLIIENSKKEIEGVQENVDTLLGGEDAFGFTWLTEMNILNFIKNWK